MIVKNNFDYKILSRDKFFFLIYGENFGLVEETKKKIIFEFKNNINF